ncbi:hypothetical protein [Shimia sp. SDUM112013]|uniref:hypothetical protein n=1 Tax=Shimia sp. SDUM112013 TaxID=3136160 RepID=UPI0032EB16F7
MRHVILAAVAAGFLPLSLSAENLWEKVKEGASEAGAAVGNTAQDVGKVVDKAATAVGDSLDSAVEMASNEDTPEATRTRMDAVADDTLAQLLAEDPEAAALFQKSYGYAAFDARQITLAGAAAGYGRGVAVARESGARTYMKMGTGGVGIAFGIGGFERKLVILFEEAALFQDFVENGYDATARASAMSGEDAQRQEAQFVDGRRVFYLSKKGWRVATSATGTKYWKDPDLN